MKKPLVLVRVLLIVAAVAAAAAPLSAKKPPVVQYVNIAPLPGAGAALDENGKPDGQGAIQVNIPVAYTPGQDYIEVSAYAGEYIRGYGLPDNTNGNGVLGFGFGHWPRFYASGMAVSSEVFEESKVLNGQLQIFRESARTPAVAVGAQDILNKERKDFSATANTGISWFGVATKRLNLCDRPVFATVGYGAARFLDRPFAGLSTPINNYLSLSFEYDGFQLNEALSWRPMGRYSPLTILGGYNDRAGFLFGAHVTGRANTKLLAPLAYLLLRG